MVAGILWLPGTATAQFAETATWTVGSGAGHAAVTAWLAHPLAGLLMVLFLGATFYHLMLGLQVVVEDYVHNEKLKLTAIMLNNFFSAAVALASTYAVLKLSSGV